MENRKRQCVGIDCAMNELVVTFGITDDSRVPTFLSNTKFPNTLAGFKKLLAWSNKLKRNELDLFFVVEATGVYHEKFALFLYKNDCSVCVILPNKTKAFSKTLKQKTINDKTCGQMICQFGLEKNLDLWQPPLEAYNAMRNLAREKNQATDEQTQIKNQLHAEKSGAWPEKRSIQRMQKRLKLIASQIQEIKDDIRNEIERNPELKEKLRKICTIKGIGLMTAATIVAETNGFNLIRNKKQLVSYAGLDVIENSSGISKKGKTRISKRGNKQIRKALYFPALSAIRSQDTMKALFVRLVGRHGIKMKAAVAVQRKLLELIYVLWKKDQEFDPNYLKREEQPLEVALSN